MTCVPSYVEWVARFAAQAGVESQVRPLLCDAVEVPGESCFDAAVAMDSCCHMPRGALFQRLAALVRPGGHVFVTGCFLVRPEYEDLFNRHWHVRIGTLEEYLTAAKEAGLREESVTDLSLGVEPFWALTFALIQAEAQAERLNSSEAAKVADALQAHALVQEGLAKGGYRYACSVFPKADRRTMIRLDPIHVFASTLEATVHFYTTMFGARVVYDTIRVGQRNVRLDMGGTAMHLYDQPPRSADRGLIHHLGIRTDDLAGLIRHLQATGVVFRAGIREDTAFRYIMCEAPDGILLELYEVKSGGEWMTS